MVSKRRLRGRAEDVPYDMEVVPRPVGCALRPWPLGAPPEAMLSGSTLVEVGVGARDSWSAVELVQLCNEAAWRRVCADRAAGRAEPLVPHDGKPLMLEFVADRLDTDDPLWGFQVRHAASGWLQGFIALTDFTTWTAYFRFDSAAPATGITADDVELRATDGAGRGAGRRAGRGAETLAEALEREPRWGDPEQEGVVWPRVAEVSLLGGLGCGAWILRLALEALAAKSYRFVVLQATDQAIPFYEQVGTAHFYFEQLFIET